MKEKTQETTAATEKDVLSGVAMIEKIIKKSQRARRRRTLIFLAFVVVFAAVAGIFAGPEIKSILKRFNPEPTVTVITELTESGKSEILQDQTIKIREIIIGESRQRKELLVMEQDISVDSVWESTWIGLDIFKKTKRIVSHGTGYYNVDLSGISQDAVVVDRDRRSVTIVVPHSFLKYVSIDEGKTQYEDTQNGLLSFGELKLTLEQQGLLKTAVEADMRKKLETPELFAQADEFACSVLEELYQPLVTSISDGYTVTVNIE